MASNIKACIEELKDIQSEIKTQNANLKQLRDRKKQLEADIFKYLEDSDQEGLRYQNIIFMKTNKKKRDRKKKDEKETDIQKVLEKHGVEDSKQAVSEVLEAMKGSQSEVSCLKMRAATLFESI